MKRSKVLPAVVLAAALLASSVILSACGGGGGSAAAPASTKVTIKGTLPVGTFHVVSKSRFRFALWDYVNPVNIAYALSAGRNVSTVVAVGSDGSYNEGSLAVDGSFSVAVAPGASYVVTMLDTVTTPTTIQVAGTILADSGTNMDAFPVTTSSASTIDLGNITLASGASTTASGNSALVSLGTSSNIANVYGVIDDFMVRLSNVDADANGVVDYKEGKKYNFFVSYHFKYDPAVVSTTTFTYLQTFSSGTFYSDWANIQPSGYQYTLWENPMGAAMASHPSTTWIGAVLTMPASVNSSTTTTACYVMDLPNDPDFPGRFVDFFCSGSANSPTTPPAGDYLISSGSTTLIYLKNVRTQTIDASLNKMFFPVGRMTVDGGTGAITVSWKWVKNVGPGWADATDTEIQAVMSTMLWGLFDNLGGSGHNKDYKLPLTATGTFTSSTPAVLGFTPSRTGFTWIDKAGFAYGLGDY